MNYHKEDDSKYNVRLFFPILNVFFCDWYLLHIEKKISAWLFVSNKKRIFSNKYNLKCIHLVKNNTRFDNVTTTSKRVSFITKWINFKLCYFKHEFCVIWEHLSLYLILHLFRKITQIKTKTTTKKLDSSLIFNVMYWTANDNSPKVKYIIWQDLRSLSL